VKLARGVIFEVLDLDAEEMQVEFERRWRLDFFAYRVWVCVEVICAELRMGRVLIRGGWGLGIGWDSSGDSQFSILGYL
jgi:hypothetical protein